MSSMEGAVLHRESSGWWRGFGFVIGGCCALLASVLWLGNMYLAPAKVSALRAYGAALPEEIRLLSGIETEQIRIAEFSLAEAGTKIGIAIAPGRSEAVATVADPVEAARQYQVDKIESPNVPIVLLRYIAAQFDAWRAGEKTTVSIDLLGKPATLMLCRAKEELRYGVVLFQTPEGPAVLVAQRRGEYPDAGLIRRFVEGMPRFKN